MQSIDLLSVHGYNFVNFREIHVEMLLSLLGVSVTLEKALSAPTPSPDQEDMNFYLIVYLL